MKPDTSIVDYSELPEIYSDEILSREFLGQFGPYEMYRHDAPAYSGAYWRVARIGLAAAWYAPSDLRAFRPKTSAYLNLGKMPPQVIRQAIINRVWFGVQNSFENFSQEDAKSLGWYREDESRYRGEIIYGGEIKDV